MNGHLHECGHLQKIRKQLCYFFSFDFKIIQLLIRAVERGGLGLWASGGPWGDSKVGEKKKKEKKDKRRKKRRKERKKRKSRVIMIKFRLEVFAFSK